MWRSRTAAPRRRPPAPPSGRQQAPRGAARGPKPGRKPAKSGIFLPSAPRHPDPQLPTEEHARRRARSRPSAPKRVRKQGRARQTHLCTERNQFAARKRRGFLCQDFRSAPGCGWATGSPILGSILRAVFQHPRTSARLPTRPCHSPPPAAKQGRRREKISRARAAAPPPPPPGPGCTGAVPVPVGRRVAI